MPWAKPTTSSTKRGYGQAHKKLRAALLPTAYGTPCARCGYPMLQGQALHLDHNDTRTAYLGFSHADCNLSAAAAKAKIIKQYGKRTHTAHRW